MIKEKVLQELEKNKGSAISGAALARTLGVSRTAVWKAINNLIAEGYEITKSQSVGYSLSQNSDKLSEAVIRNHLKHNIDLFMFDEVDSTNTKAVSLTASGAEHGTVIIAEKQTAGKGRLGRSFYSPKDTGIYFSIILKPSMDIEKSLLLTTASAVAVVRAIKEICNIDTQIKWVNDIYFNNKKICGILTEAITDFENGHISYVIAGIGINCTTSDFKGDLAQKAGALNIDHLDRNRLIAVVIDNVLYITKAISNGDTSFIDEYRKHSMIIGNKITVHPTPVTDMSNAVKAVALDIDNHGGLIVRYDDGRIDTLSTGEISIRLQEK